MIWYNSPQFIPHFFSAIPECVLDVVLVCVVPQAAHEHLAGEVPVAVMGNPVLSRNSRHRIFNIEKNQDMPKLATVHFHRGRGLRKRARLKFFFDDRL